MAIGCMFEQSLQKCLRSLEFGHSGHADDGKRWRVGTKVDGNRDILPRDVISCKLSVPNAELIFFIRHALSAGFTIENDFLSLGNLSLVSDPNQRGHGFRGRTGGTKELSRLST